MDDGWQRSTAWIADIGEGGDFGRRAVELSTYSANASATLSASADVSACEMFDSTDTTIPRSRSVTNDTTFPAPARGAKT